MPLAVLIIKTGLLTRTFCSQNRAIPAHYLEHDHILIRLQRRKYGHDQCFYTLHTKLFCV